MEFALEHDFMKSHGSLLHSPTSFVTSTDAASVQAYRLNNMEDEWNAQEDQPDNLRRTV